MTSHLNEFNTRQGNNHSCAMVLLLCLDAIIGAIDFVLVQLQLSRGMFVIFVFVYVMLFDNKARTM